MNWLVKHNKKQKEKERDAEQSLLKLSSQQTLENIRLKNTENYCCFCGMKIYATGTILVQHHIFGKINSSETFACHRDCHNRFHTLASVFNGGKKIGN